MTRRMRGADDGPNGERLDRVQCQVRGRAAVPAGTGRAACQECFRPVLAARMFVDVPTTDGAGVGVVAAGSGTRAASPAAGAAQGRPRTAFRVLSCRNPSLIARDVTENNGHNAIIINKLMLGLVSSFIYL